MNTVNTRKIDMLLEVIHDIIKADGPYKDKIQDILAVCGPDDRNHLEEFKAWLEEMFPEEE